LAHLGAVAPDVFTRACDGCGARTAWGAECTECKTRVEPTPPQFPDDEEDGETPLPVPLPELLPRTATQPIRWLQRRWLLLQLTLCVLWRRFDAWMAERRARAIP
jgi:hypothetical protein